MRILSLWQPWASLLVGGAKLIETRKWSTSYRGPIAVHAAKHWDEDLAARCRTEPFRSALERLGITDAPVGHAASLPRGAILGIVDLAECLRMVTGVDGPSFSRIDIKRDPRLTETEIAFGLYEPGRFAWVTGASRLVLDKPIPFRGAQGLRELDPAVAARLA